MAHRYYIYHKILNYASQNLGRLISPFKEVVSSDSQLSLTAVEMVPIIDKLESDGLILTKKGVGSEHKRIMANESTSEFLQNGGYLNSENLKIHEILRWLAEQVESNPNKHSFNTEEILDGLFLTQLNLPVNIGEVNYLVRTLIDEDDVIDVTTKDNVGTKGLMVKDDTLAAFHGKKYLNIDNSSPISQTITIENFQSNEGIIEGNQTFDNRTTSESRTSSNKWIGIVALFLTAVGIVVSILIAQGII